MSLPMLLTCSTWMSVKKSVSVNDSSVTCNGCRPSLNGYASQEFTSALKVALHKLLLHMWTYDFYDTNLPTDKQRRHMIKYIPPTGFDTETTVHPSSKLDFWPGLGLPRPKAIVVIPKNQPLPKHLRKKRVKCEARLPLRYKRKTR